MKIAYDHKKILNLLAESFDLEFVNQHLTFTILRTYENIYELFNILLTPSQNNYQPNISFKESLKNECSTMLISNHLDSFINQIIDKIILIDENLEQDAIDAIDSLKDYVEQYRGGYNIFQTPNGYIYSSADVDDILSKLETLKRVVYRTINNMDTIPERRF